MRNIALKLKESALAHFFNRNEKYFSLLFFIGGFTFDVNTLARIDKLIDLIILSAYMLLLSLCIYLFNLAHDEKWSERWLGNIKDYMPLAIQFFFGGLASAFVVYFSRSVSLSETAFFFAILVLLLITNELIKNSLSNRYLQVGIYFFISFTFFIFITPVIVKKMNHYVFILSGLLSLTSTLLLIRTIHKASDTSKSALKKGKIYAIVIAIYLAINGLYYFKLIPPIPLALKNKMVAHELAIQDGKYKLTYEKRRWYELWKDYRDKFVFTPGKHLYVFTSIFAPTEIDKKIIHRYSWFNETNKEWEVTDNIGYKIAGGRDDGFRGYTYKRNIKAGLWQVEVITEEDLVIGVVDFEVVIDPDEEPKRLSEIEF